MVAAALVAVILWQRSEGGALGIGGGGGGGGGFLTGRGTANLLTRTTAILALCFFVTSILLTFMSQQRAGPSGSAFDRPAATAPAAPSSDAPASAPAEAPRGGILDRLQ